MNIKISKGRQREVLGGLGTAFLPVRATTTLTQLQNGSTGYYEALRETPNRTPIPAAGISMLARTLTASMNRQRLVALARYIYDNYGRVGYAVNMIANYSTPVMPQATTKDAKANALYDAYWEDWCGKCDFTGRFRFARLLRQICIAMDVDGDIGVVMTNVNGWPQIQLIEGWRIGCSRTQAEIGIVDGVRIDKEGRVLGYLVDDENEFDASTMTLIGDTERYSSYRSISPLRRGMNDIRDVSDIKGFEKMGAKIGSALAAVIEGDGPIEEDIWGNDTGNGGNMPAEGDGTVTPMAKKISMAELLGGDIPVIENGQLKQIENKRPGTNLVEFLNFLCGEFVTGLDLPPAFIMDEKLTGPNIRGVNGKAQRKFDQRTADIAVFVEWCWVRVIGHGIVTGALPAADKWWVCEWSGPSRVSIDDGRDSESWRKDIDRGVMTRSRRLSNEGLNFHRETSKTLEELDYISTGCANLAKKHGVPIETYLACFGITAQKPSAQETTPEETGEMTEDGMPEEEPRNKENESDE